MEDDFGNLYAYAVFNEGADNYNIFWKLDASGNLLIKKSNSGAPFYNDGIIKSNGNLVFVEEGVSFINGASAFEMDASGNVIWSKLITSVNRAKAQTSQNCTMAIWQFLSSRLVGSVTYQSGLYICNDTLDVLSTTLHGGDNTSGFGKIIQHDDLGIVHGISTRAFSFTTELNFQSGHARRHCWLPRAIP